MVNAWHRFERTKHVCNVRTTRHGEQKSRIQNGENAAALPIPPPFLPQHLSTLPQPPSLWPRTLAYTAHNRLTGPLASRWVSTEAQRGMVGGFIPLIPSCDIARGCCCPSVKSPLRESILPNFSTFYSVLSHIVNLLVTKINLTWVDYGSYSLSENKGVGREEKSATKRKSG